MMVGMTTHSEHEPSALDALPDAEGDVPLRGEIHRPAFSNPPVDLDAAAAQLGALVSTAEFAASLIVDTVKGVLRGELSWLPAQARYPLGTKAPVLDPVELPPADRDTNATWLRDEAERRYAKAEESFRKKNSYKAAEHLRVAAALDGAADEIEQLRTNEHDLQLQVADEQAKKSRIELLYGIEMARSDALFTRVVLMCGELHMSEGERAPCDDCFAVLDAAVMLRP
jgi:hypothetical protein